MALNTIDDLSETAASNVDVLGQSTLGTATANTIDTIVQSTLGLLARAYGDLGGIGTVAGTADAITLASRSTYQSLGTGLIVTFKAASANTGAATLNLDSLGVKKIRRKGDTALSANDIIANGRYILMYDAAYDTAAGAWVLMNPEITSSVSAATQAEMEAASSTTVYVTPGRQKNHPNMVKAWGLISTATGTPISLASNGISSLGDDGTGQWTVNFTTSFSGIYYGVQVSANSSSTTLCRTITYNTLATGSVKVVQVDEAGSAVDGNDFTISVIGDQ